MLDMRAVTALCMERQHLVSKAAEPELKLYNGMPL